MSIAQQNTQRDMTLEHSVLSAAPVFTYATSHICATNAERYEVALNLA